MGTALYLNQPEGRPFDGRTAFNSCSELWNVATDNTVLLTGLMPLPPRRLNLHTSTTTRW
jgi:hypothetical protein